jgi:hypothetical protein
MSMVTAKVNTETTRLRNLSRWCMIVALKHPQAPGAVIAISESGTKAFDTVPSIFTYMGGDL